MGWDRVRALDRERRCARQLTVTAHRGEVWLVDFGEPVGREQSGRRPAVVVSADPLNESRAGVVIVIPTTTTPRGLPSHVEIDPTSSGLDEVSYMKCEDVKSIAEQRLIARLGRVSDAALFEVARVLRFLLNIWRRDRFDDQARAAAFAIVVETSPTIFGMDSSGSSSFRAKRRGFMSTSSLQMARPSSGSSPRSSLLVAIAW